MITYCGPGDVKARTDGHIVITVNTVGVMGAGIALWFKNQCPDGFERYRQKCLSGEFKVGMLMTHTGRNGQKYLLFPTKKDWKFNSHPAIIEVGLHKLVDTYIDRGFASLSIPPLGCGHGNLDFETQVKPLLYKYLDPITIPVNIFLG